ncbi:MAG TPA: glycoside hydrolase family 127 protein [Armatimonadota bacterium]|nr:glycoside hydrolase family 127 protein [Armatimonadota bacterium]
MDHRPIRNLDAVPIQQVTLNDPFWSPKMDVWRRVTLIDCFNKLEANGALANFDLVARGEAGEHGGPPWYDGLLYETIRAAGDFLAAGRDATLEARVDGYVERIAAAAARDPDGYVNTWTQLKQPGQRWGMNGGDDNWQHDLYNAGALVEAAIHYYRATGRIRLLELATRLANHMVDVMGPPPKANVVPGHSIAEEAFVRLHLLFGEQPELRQRMPVPVDAGAYLRLAQFWIENRGHTEGRRSFGPYGQDHVPVLEQETIEGHAVRATLLCAGLVEAGVAAGRSDYLDAAVRLWENMVCRRMYITGGLGAVAGYEGFGPDYALPNTGYVETCAAVGAGFFHHNLSLALGHGRYADELERVLYNAVLCGTSLVGDSYFYENPLEAGPDRRRWAWHPCPCCPPMFLKMMAAMPGYLYATDGQQLVVNLLVGSEARVSLGGVPVRVCQTTEYPWREDVELGINPEGPARFGVAVRIPGWCDGATFALNGEPVRAPQVADGYARFWREWRPGDRLELQLPMPVRRMKAHPAVQDAAGRIALTRGPVIYCVEGIDCAVRPRHLIVPPDASLAAEHRADLLGGVTAIRGLGLTLRRQADDAPLYRRADDRPETHPVEFTAIPYYANANREPTELRVWLSASADVLPPTIATDATASASHCHRGDTLSALNDQLPPAHSADDTVPRFSWWDHRGTQEWVQYDFREPECVAGVEVYWLDDSRHGGGCSTPASWRLLYRKDGEWRSVAGATAYGVDLDRANRVVFDRVETTALRIEVTLRPERSGGILEWCVLGA